MSADATDPAASPADDAPERLVPALLAAAGLRPPPQEVERLTELYGGMQRQLAALWALDLDDEGPASVFRAAEVGA
jgi:hypothetical protein